MKYFHGAKKSRAYFEGWYLKHVKGNQAISFIPAFHADEAGNQTASLQVIYDTTTKSGCCSFDFPISSFAASPQRFRVKIGQNYFCKEAISINLENDELSIKGRLFYGPFSQLKYDIMGPFHYVPFMQCNHGILSMYHKIWGFLTINGVPLDLDGGDGYIEKDFGTSFPTRYLWTQSMNVVKGSLCSISTSAADIPFGPGSFTGCICSVFYRGKEYRFATYLGAKIALWRSDRLVVTQGAYTLSVLKLPDEKPEAPFSPGPDVGRLRAPLKGGMSRTIVERLSCPLHYRLMQGDKVLMDFTSLNGSFETDGL